MWRKPIAWLILSPFILLFAPLLVAMAAVGGLTGLMWWAAQIVLEDR